MTSSFHAMLIFFNVERKRKHRQTCCIQILYWFNIILRYQLSTQTLIQLKIHIYNNVLKYFIKLHRCTIGFNKYIINTHSKLNLDDNSGRWIATSNSNIQKTLKLVHIFSTIHALPTLDISIHALTDSHPLLELSFKHEYVILSCCIQLIS